MVTLKDLEPHSRLDFRFGYKCERAKLSAFVATILEKGLFNLGIRIYLQLPWRYTWQDLKDKFKGAGKTQVILFYYCKVIPLSSKSAKIKKKPHFANVKKQLLPCKSTVEEVSFEWSHYRISSTNSKVRTTLHVSIVDAGGESLNLN